MSIDNRNRELDQKVQELLELNARLEARATERTAELEETIGKLRLTAAELETAKNAAEEASRAKSLFLARMSHEIRTPMNGILGMTQLALDSNPTEEQREFLDMVKSSAGSLMTIINDILDFSKVEAGRLDLEFVPFKIREVLTAAANSLSERAHEKKLELVVDVLENVPETIVGDSMRLKQVLLNLVGNAIRFTPKGEIVVRVELGQHVDNSAVLSFSVTDTGIGILPEKQASIFEAFNQKDDSNTRQYGGAGLGLAISAKLVRMMGGELELDSVVGAGSIFQFRLSFGVQESGPTPDAQQSVDLTDLPVLVVDDNATNGRVLETMLKRWRLKPTVARDGPSAIDIMLRAERGGDPFRLVILDSDMPGMDGFMVVENVRANPLLAGATMMMLTSGGQRDDFRRCRELGLAAYLTKPVAQDSLFEAVKTIIAAHPATHSRSVKPIAPESPNAADPLYVLVAEDNWVNQVLIKRLLERLGHRVHLVDTGFKAVQAVERENFGLIFMDVQMPNIDGFEATKTIREKEKHTGGHIPIIALTAHAMKGDRERCLDAGMDAYLSKPVDMKQLVSAIQSVSADNVPSVSDPHPG